MSGPFFKFRQPGFGVEIDLLRESLQVEKYPRARGAEEVHAGNNFREKKWERGMGGGVCQTDF